MLPCAKNLQHLRGHVSGDGFYQPQRSLDGILGVTDLPQVGEDGLHRGPDPVKLRGREQVIDREVLHQRVVVIDGGQSLLEAGVCVK